MPSWPLEPSMELETREFWEVLGGCLAKLPEGLADAFFLRELDGLESEHIQRGPGNHARQSMETTPSRTLAAKGMPAIELVCV